MDVDAVPCVGEPRHGGGLCVGGRCMGALRATPSPGHGAEAEVVADGSEPSRRGITSLRRSGQDRRRQSLALLATRRGMAIDRPWLKQTRRTHDFVSAVVDVFTRKGVHPFGRSGLLPGAAKDAGGGWSSGFAGFWTKVFARSLTVAGNNGAMVHSSPP